MSPSGSSTFTLGAGNIVLSGMAGPGILKLDASEVLSVAALDYSELPFYNQITDEVTNGSTITGGSWVRLVEASSYNRGIAQIEFRTAEGNHIIHWSVMQRIHTVDIKSNQGYNSGINDVVEWRVINDQNGAGSWDQYANKSYFEVKLNSSGTLGANTWKIRVRRIYGSDSQFNVSDFAAAATPDGTTIVEAASGTLCSAETAYATWRVWTAACSVYGTRLSLWNTGWLYIEGTHPTANTPGLKLASNSVADYGNLFVDPDYGNGGLLYQSDTGYFTLYNTTRNTIYYHNAGVAFPTFSTRSTGAKIVLYPSLNSVSSDYAIGIGSSTLWIGVPAADTRKISFYGGTTELGRFGGPSGAAQPWFTTFGRGAFLLSSVSGYTSDGAGIWIANESTYTGASTNLFIGFNGTASTATFGIYRNAGWQLTFSNAAEMGVGRSFATGYRFLAEGIIGSTGSSAKLWIGCQSTGFLGDGYELFVPTDGVLKVRNANTNTYAMTILDSCDVGIATESPQGKLHVDGRFHLSEQAANPIGSDLTSTTYDYPTDRVAVYMKANKLIIAYVVDGSSTVHYTYLPLDGSSSTWTHTTTAP